MSTERAYERASETARILVSTCLEDEAKLRRKVVLAVRGASPLALADLVEVLVLAVGATYDDLDEFSAHVVKALADQYRTDGDEP